MTPPVIVRTCEVCRRRFEVTDPGALGAIASGHGPRWCGKTCRRKAKKAERSQQKGPCNACDNPYGPQMSAYGLGLCASCQYVAYRSCWSKIPFPDEESVPREVTGETMYPYPCRCCPNWHMSRHGAIDDVPDYVRRLDQIGALIEREGFNIQERRGWTHHRLASLE